MTLDPDELEIKQMIYYRHYPISRPCEEDYVVEIANDTLGEAKSFIDRLIAQGLIEETEEANNEHA